eukprot:m.29370 g.29370  ORF g.29370 m.29370 type:complete len:366 (+) comp12106_c0_seq1:100-1197(+)
MEPARETKRLRVEGTAISGLAAIVASDESMDVKGAAVPLVIIADPAMTVEQSSQWVVDNQPGIEGLLKVHGAILFRGFPFTSVEHFDGFVTAFQGWEDLSYEDSLSFAVRVRKSGRICTTNEGRTGGLVFHHEQAQSPRWPSKLFFCCEKAAEAGDGGFTGVCRSDLVLEQLAAKHPEFVAKCEALGVKYTIYTSETDDSSKGVGRSWKSFFSAKDRPDCEKRMTALGYTWEWLEGGTLKATTPRLEAVVTAPGTATKCFFNQLPATTNNALEFSKVGTEGSDLHTDLDATPTQAGINKCLAFGDGSEVSIDALMDARAICERNAVDLQWRDGDVALLDNYIVMHARRIWHGPLGSRKLLASLVQ